MLSAAFELVPFALLATLSPVGLAATITVMSTGRLRALAFALGVVFGQLLACSFLVGFGDVVTPERTRSYPTFEGIVKLGLALALLAYASVVYHRPEPARPTSNGRSKAALERFRHLHVVTAGGVGLLLGIGGPKRLVLTALASASIAAAGFTGRDEAVLIAFYGLLATLLVWLPVLAFLLVGNWARARLDAAADWLSRHRRPATVYVLVIVGLALLVDAVLLL